MRVLHVEDDSATAASIAMMLRAENFIVDTTDLGEDGLEIGKLYDYDIIILDLMLPDIDGYEVLRRLRTARVSTPILILSALGSLGSEPKIKGLGFGADDFLTNVSDADFSNEGFPFGTSREIERGYARVRASRVTYVGELGWELLIPAEFAQHVFDVVAAAGADHGLHHAGYFALNSLRMERGYRHWGHDIGDEDTPAAAGLGFAVAWEKHGGPLTVTRRIPVEHSMTRYDFRP